VKIIQVRNRERDADLGDQIAVADRWWPQLRGLLGRPEPQPGEGLLIVDSQAIHMYGMKYPIDVAMLDRERRVIAVYPRIAPGKRSRMHWKAKYALELPQGTLTATGTEVGDLLEW